MNSYDLELKSSAAAVVAALRIRDPRALRRGCVVFTALSDLDASMLSPVSLPLRRRQGQKGE